MLTSVACLAMWRHWFNHMKNRNENIEETESLLYMTSFNADVKWCSALEVCVHRRTNKNPCSIEIQRLFAPFRMHEARLGLFNLFNQHPAQQIQKKSKNGIMSLHVMSPVIFCSFFFLLVFFVIFPRSYSPFPSREEENKNHAHTKNLIQTSLSLFNFVRFQPNTNTHVLSTHEGTNTKCHNTIRSDMALMACAVRLCVCMQRVCRHTGSEHIDRASCKFEITIKSTARDTWHWTYTKSMIRFEIYSEDSCRVHNRFCTHTKIRNRRKAFRSWSSCDCVCVLWARARDQPLWMRRINKSTVRIPFHSLKRKKREEFGRFFPRFFFPFDPCFFNLIYT